VNNAMLIYNDTITGFSKLLPYDKLKVIFIWFRLVRTPTDR
jgi:hypothetical protein